MIKLDFIFFMKDIDTYFMVANNQESPTNIFRTKIYNQNTKS